jgi:sestrin
MRLLSFHPEFLKEFVTFYNYLMYGQFGGTLSFDMRHLVAILAAGRHKCIYLIEQQEREFLLQNGPKSWLNGLENMPAKLKDLHDLNKLLCHQPWLVNQTHIQVFLI